MKKVIVAALVLLATCNVAGCTNNANSEKASTVSAKEMVADQEEHRAVNKEAEKLGEIADSKDLYNIEYTTEYYSDFFGLEDGTELFEIPETEIQEFPIRLCEFQTLVAPIVIEMESFEQELAPGESKEIALWTKWSNKGTKNTESKFVVENLSDQTQNIRDCYVTDIESKGEQLFNFLGCGFDDYTVTLGDTINDLGMLGDFTSNENFQVELFAPDGTGISLILEGSAEGEVVFDRLTGSSIRYFEPETEKERENNIRKYEKQVASVEEAVALITAQDYENLYSGQVNFVERRKKILNDQNANVGSTVLTDAFEQYFIEQVKRDFEPDYKNTFIMLNRTIGKKHYFFNYDPESNIANIQCMEGGRNFQLSRGLYREPYGEWLSKIDENASLNLYTDWEVAVDANTLETIEIDSSILSVEEEFEYIQDAFNIAFYNQSDENVLKESISVKFEADPASKGKQTNVLVKVSWQYTDGRGAFVITTFVPDDYQVGVYTPEKVYWSVNGKAAEFEMYTHVPDSLIDYFDIVSAYSRGNKNLYDVYEELESYVTGLEQRLNSVDHIPEEIRKKFDIEERNYYIKTPYETGYSLERASIRKLLENPQDAEKYFEQRDTMIPQKQEVWASLYDLVPPVLIDGKHVLIEFIDFVLEYKEGWDLEDLMEQWKYGFEVLDSTTLGFVKDDRLCFTVALDVIEDEIEIDAICFQLGEKNGNKLETIDGAVTEEQLIAWFGPADIRNENDQTLEIAWKFDEGQMGLKFHVADSQITYIEISKGIKTELMEESEKYQALYEEQQARIDEIYGIFSEQKTNHGTTMLTADFLNYFIEQVKRDYEPNYRNTYVQLNKSIDGWTYSFELDYDTNIASIHQLGDGATIWGYTDWKTITNETDLSEREIPSELLAVREDFDLIKDVLNVVFFKEISDEILTDTVEVKFAGDSENKDATKFVHVKTSWTYTDGRVFEGDTTFQLTDPKLNAKTFFPYKMEWKIDGRKSSAYMTTHVLFSTNEYSEMYREACSEMERTDGAWNPFVHLEEAVKGYEKELNSVESIPEEIRQKYNISERNYYIKTEYLAGSSMLYSYSRILKKRAEKGQ